MLGDFDYGIGGGVEVMSRGSYMMPALRSGARMGDTKAVDMMVAVLTDPFGVGHMGLTAEKVAQQFERPERAARTKHWDACLRLLDRTDPSYKH